jgi:hypothetical protein
VTTTTTRSTADTPTRAAHSRAFDVLIGLAALAVLLQGLWAGLFMRDGGQGGQGWVDVHARGAEAAIVLAALAAVVAFVKMRERTDLWLGSAALAAALVVEAYVGGLIGDGKGSLTAVHVPLAMIGVALAVWLPLRARHRTR